METINIFVGSSIAEDRGLTGDRDKLASFVNGLNNRYVDRGYYIHLYLCENESVAMVAGGSQNKHNEFIENSADASFFLFFEDAGKYTLEELALARKTLISKDRPAVYVFFKTNGTEPENTESIKNAVDIIANEYSHYYKLYHDIDTVKLEILQFFASKLQAGKLQPGAIMAQDGKIYLDNEVVDQLELNNIFAYQNSKEYKELSAEIAQLKKEIDAAVQKNDSQEILRLCDTKSKKTKELHELEKNILEVLELLQKEFNKKDVDQTRISMLRLLEQGKYKEAIALCPPSEVERKAELFKKKERIIVEEAKNGIETIKLCIFALKKNYLNPNRFDEINRLYSAARDTYVSTAQDGEIVIDYVDYLYGQKDFKKAVEIGEKLQDDFESGRLYGEPSQRARLFHSLAILYKDAHRLEEAEKCYKNAIEIRERLARENPAKYERDLADCYEGIGHVYLECKRFEEEIASFKKALEIRSRLTLNEFDTLCFSALCAALILFYTMDKRYKEAEELYKINIKRLEQAGPKFASALASNYNGLATFYRDTTALASNYNGLATFHRDTIRFLLAEEFYRKAIKIRQELVQENPSENESDLAISYNNLANVYYHTNNKEAEEFYKKSIEIYERLVQENATKYGRDLAINYDNLANVYHDTKRDKEAEEFYKKSIEIYERLVQENATKYGRDLAVFYNHLANAYRDTKRHKEAAEFYKKFIEMYERLMQENPIKYGQELAVNYDNLANVYHDTKRDKEAEEFYKKSIEIYERLVQENPTKYGRDLAIKYDSLANAYRDAKMNKEAEEFNEKAIEIFERLAQENPAQYECDLAICYHNSAALYDCIRRLKKAEKFNDKAIEIYEKLVQGNSVAYELELVKCYYIRTKIFVRKLRFQKANESIIKALKIAKKYPQDSFCKQILERCRRNEKYSSILDDYLTD